MSYRAEPDLYSDRISSRHRRIDRKVLIMSYLLHASKTVLGSMIDHAREA